MYQALSMLHSYLFFFSYNTTIYSDELREDLNDRYVIINNYYVKLFDQKSSLR